MPTMNVSLPQALAEFVEEEVARGDYASASEVVRDGLRLLRRERDLHQDKLQALRHEIALGIGDVREGRMTPFSVAEIAAELDREEAQ
ncbi:MAG: hypothetical protein RLY86_3629 [Pseudomonadota bacterium]|jgi:antitoxin ParD1/3/4